jgi:hypothetical protein
MSFAMVACELRICCWNSSWDCLIWVSNVLKRSVLLSSIVSMRLVRVLIRV